MDRTSFLKAQPYLFPLERSVSWPPPLPPETADRSISRMETLLRDFALSIESLPSSSSSEHGTSLSQQSIIVSIGPAFFAKPIENVETTSKKKRAIEAASSCDNDKFDPAMCPMDLVVHSATLKHSPLTPHHGESFPRSFSNRFTSPTAYQKILRRQHAANPMSHATPQIQESTIYLKLDGHCYQLDLSYIENIELQEENYDDNDASRPTSLMIQFGTVCVFRIFSTKNDQSFTSALKTVQTLLIRLLTADDHVPSEFPVRFSMLASPTGSSTTTGFSSANEPGQGDFSRPQHHHQQQKQQQQTPTNGDQGLLADEHSSSKSFSVNVVPLNPHPANDSQLSVQSIGTERGQSSSECQGPREGGAPPIEMDRLSVIRQRQAALSQAIGDISSLDELLLRSEVENHHPKRRRVIQDRALELMRSIPDCLAASYESQSQLESVLQHQNEKIHGYEVQLNELIQSFWPGSRKGSIGSGTGGGNLSRDVPIKDRPPPVDADECIQKANALLAQHKATLVETMAVSQLPNRG